MITFAVIGAAGQVGRRLMQVLSRQAGARVFGITRNAMSAGPLRADELDIRVGSVVDEKDGAELLRGADVVVNAALEIDRPKRARARNEALVSSLLAHSRSTLVVHFSSVAVYGSCVDGTFSTFERPRPDSTYGREKLRLERFAMQAAAGTGQRLMILRLGHVYGPGQGISREFFDVLRDRLWDLPFGGALPSNAIHVDHLAAALPIVARTAAGQSVVNATDSPQRTWRALYDMHARAAGYAPAGSMDPASSASRHDEFKRLAALSLSRRVPQQVSAWARQLPLKSLVSVKAVRQATEAALLALPVRVEQLIDRRYAVFSAGQNLEAGGSVAVQEPPPWYYSDGIVGPTLPEILDTDQRLAAEIGDLRDWYATWAAPAWRTASSAGPRG